MCAVPLSSTAGTRKEFQYCDCRSVGAAGDNLLGDLLHRVQESKGLTLGTQASGLLSGRADILSAFLILYG
jgi:hypothetical protein